MGGLRWDQLFEDVPWFDTPDPNMDKEVARRVEKRIAEKKARDEAKKPEKKD